MPADRRRFLILLLSIGGLVLYVSTACVNIGIVALDDYHEIVAQIIPAQFQSATQIIAGAGIRSPVPSLVLLTLSRTALHLGLTDPVAQYRFVLIVLAIFSFAVLSTVARRHFRDERDGNKEIVALCLISFFWLAPYFFSRTLIESLAAPFVAASAWFTTDYWLRGRRSSLALSVFALMVAATFRFQVGVCYAAIVAVFVLRRQWRDSWVLLASSAVAFMIPGLIDLWLRGSFYASLRAYVDYNVHYSSSYGVHPFYSFVTLFLAITIPPAFWLRYRGLRWREEYRPLLPALLFFAVFLVAHSAVPHKEDRFMVPIVPVFLICLVPLAHYIWQKSRWRTVYFLAINAVLLVITSFTVEQRNTIGLVLYLGRHPEITRVVGVDETLVLYPSAYTLRPPADTSVAASDLAGMPMTCNTAIAVRQAFKTSVAELNAKGEKVAEFRPGLLEQLVIRINPGSNARRTTIELYRGPGCGG
ncbi:MAG TPA: hypothetical protein VGM20_08825 [Gemmatimonadales bacterium]|jgi:hypothetical protein